MSNLYLYFIMEIDSIIALLLVVGIIGAVVSGTLYLIFSEDEYNTKYLKPLKRLFVICIIMNIGGFLLPSSDTLIALKVKDMITAENYKWTVDQLKGAVDYIITSINSIK